MERAARHLEVGPRRLHALSMHTPLQHIKPVALGRSLGTYRLIPLLGVVVLQQHLAAKPWHLAAWHATLETVLASDAWRQAIDQLREEAWAQHGSSGGSTAVEALLRAPGLCAAMEALQHELVAALHAQGLEDLIQLEEMVVDRLEDEEDAVVLVGPEERAYMLPRTRLRAVGLDHEKSAGVLLATHTGDGIRIDVWPAMRANESAEWRPDPDLLRHRIEVGASRGPFAAWAATPAVACGAPFA
jgi:hypothetical protein